MVQVFIMSPPFRTCYVKVMSSIALSVFDQKEMVLSICEYIGVFHARNFSCLLCHLHLTEILKCPTSVCR